MERLLEMVDRITEQMGGTPIPTDKQTASESERFEKIYSMNRWKRIEEVESLPPADYFRYFLWFSERQKEREPKSAAFYERCSAEYRKMIERIETA
jgi:hypothetical protein